MKLSFYVAEFQFSRVLLLPIEADNRPPLPFRQSKRTTSPRAINPAKKAVRAMPCPGPGSMFASILRDLSEPGAMLTKRPLPSSARKQYCSARDLTAIFNFFIFKDLQKGTGDARIVRSRYHRKHLWIVTCYYKIS